jgi:sigma-B regulation protein RsbQ
VSTSAHPQTLHRHNVTVTGRPDGRPMVLVHGFGCDQRMWRHVVPAFEPTHRVVLLDLVGAGGSDLGDYDEDRHGSLHGHAEDLLELAPTSACATRSWSATRSAR